MSIFTGCAVAIVTPFLSDGSVDYERFSSLINWQIEEGIDAIVVCGTTGEASTLSDDEIIEVIDFVIKKVNGRVPVIAGAGSNDTKHCIEKMQKIQSLGVDGLLLVTPYYNKCSQEGLKKHYLACADSVNIPIILYSVPSRTGVNINPDTVYELSKHKNIIGIKEASGNISQVVEIARLVSKDFSIYSGNDDLVIPIMALGGKGYISVVANIAPKISHEMSKKYLNGDVKAACDIQLQMKPLIDSLFEDVNPVPVKAALHMMGKCELEYRLPLCAPNQRIIESLNKEMLAFGILK